MKFLSIEGVQVLWNKIKNNFLPLNGGGVLNGGDITIRFGNRLIVGEVEPPQEGITPQQRTHRVTTINTNGINIQSTQVGAMPLLGNGIMIDGQPYATNISDDELSKILI